MKIIVEKNIPFIAGVLDPYAEVSYLSADAITPGAMADADALITRTRTRCDATLLDASRCRFIATATIGTDHIDLDYCRRRGITVANAPGCNAPAVAQYVLASLIQITPDQSLAGKTLAVVGVGHVGSITARWAEALGMKVMRVDPPRAEAEGPEGFSTLADAAREADFITLHTPLTSTGPHATHHLADEEFFRSLRRRPVIVNAARGPVVDNQALVAALDRGDVSAAVIDCWEGEPAISPALLSRAVVATPHIAGYSREGKIRATAMALDALCCHFGLPALTPTETIADGLADPPTAAQIAASYDPAADTTLLRAEPDRFEALRNHYNYRGEPR